MKTKIAITTMTVGLALLFAAQLPSGSAQESHVGTYGKRG